MHERTSSPQLDGFTVLELLVVLAAIGLLLAVATPHYIRHVETAREVALKQNLREMRDAIDKFYADQARYPATLEELVDKRYLRNVPIDPVLQRRDGWLLVAPDGAGRSPVFDVRSGAEGRTGDGASYGSL